MSDEQVEIELTLDDPDSDTRTAQAVREAGFRYRHRFGTLVVATGPARNLASLRRRLEQSGRVGSPTGPDPSTSSIEALGKAAIERRRSSEYREAKARRPHQGQEWGTGDLEAPDAHDGEDLDNPSSTGTLEGTTQPLAVTAPPHTSERLVNEVAVGIVFVGGSDVDTHFSLR